MAAEGGVFSVDGEPSYNSCDEYIKDLLAKGKISEDELQPSVPLAESNVISQRNHVQVCSNLMAQCLHKEVELKKEIKPSPVEIKPSPVEIKPSPVEIKPSPVEIKPSPVEIKPSPVEIKSSPVEIKPSPVEIKSSPVEIKPSPVERKGLSHQVLLACLHGKVDVLQLVLAHSDPCSAALDLNAVLPCHDRLELTPLSVAAISNQPAVCKVLMKAGAAVNHVDGRGCSALHWAVLAASSAVVKALLGNGATPDTVDCEGLTPLDYACISGLPKLVAMLIKELPSLTSSRHAVTGATPLIMACYGGHHEVVKVLLKGAPPAVILRGDEQGMTAFHHATWSGSGKCTKTLIGHATWRQGLVQVDKWGRTPLITATAKGDPTICQMLLKKGLKLNQVDDVGRNMFHWAVLSGQVPLVEYLLNLRDGSSLCTGVDRDGASPLHYAAIKTDKSILTILLRQDARSATVVTTGGLTPLGWAAACGRVGNAQMLLNGHERGEGHLGVEYGPLHAAARVGALEVCQELISAGYKVHDVCPEGFTALHYASRSGHTQCVKLALSHGAQVDCLTGKQESSLHMAMAQGHSSTAEELLVAGADRDRPLEGTGDCPIHLAATGGHMAALQVILRAGGNVDHPRPSDGHTPLYLAASCGHLDCCKVLLEGGANTGTRMESSIEGLTALDIALINGHAGCVSYLMSRHAPSGGGVYHRAAATIQAVWRYHRHKCRQEISRYWSATMLQRVVRRWLCQKREKRVRQARQAALNRAARTIQSRWKQFIVEKRRYEATYARLKAKLKQEQLAAHLIIAELQYQTENICLPSSVGTQVSRKRQAGPSSMLKPRPQYLLNVTSNLCPAGTRTKPRRLLKQHSITLPPRSPPTPLTPTKLPPTLPPNSHPTNFPNSIKSPKSQDTTANAPVLQLPAISGHSSITAKPSTTPTSAGKPHPFTPGSTSGPVSGTLKLPPICNVSNGNGTRTTPALTPSHSNTSATPPFKLPTRSQLKLTRHSSTFKGTPLGYRQYLRKETRQSMEDLDLGSADEGSFRVSFSGHLDTLTGSEERLGHHDGSVERLGHQDTFTGSADRLGHQDNFMGSVERLGHQDGSVETLSGHSPASQVSAEWDIRPHNVNSSLPEDPDEEAGQKTGGVEQEVDQRRLVNQMERFERLMKVLSLLKGASGMESLEVSSEDVEMHDIKEHVKLALDEAVQLRMETSEMQRRIGVSSSTEDTNVALLIKE